MTVRRQESYPLRKVGRKDQRFDNFRKEEPCDDGGCIWDEPNMRKRYNCSTIGQCLQGCLERLALSSNLKILTSKCFRHAEKPLGVHRVSENFSVKSLHTDWARTAYITAQNESESVLNFWNFHEPLLHGDARPSVFSIFSYLIKTQSLTLLFICDGGRHLNHFWSPAGLSAAPSPHCAANCIFSLFYLRSQRDFRREASSLPLMHLTLSLRPYLDRCGISRVRERDFSKEKVDRKSVV